METDVSNRAQMDVNVKNNSHQTYPLSFYLYNLHSFYTSTLFMDFRHECIWLSVSTFHSEEALVSVFSSHLHLFSILNESEVQLHTHAAASEWKRVFFRARNHSGLHSKHIQTVWMICSFSANITSVTHAENLLPPLLPEDLCSSAWAVI